MDVPRPARWLAIGVYSVALVAFAFAITVGVPAVLLVRALDAGLTPSGLVAGGIAALWLAVLAWALVTDREARSWILFLLLGWIVALPAAARRVAALLRR